MAIPELSETEVRAIIRLLGDVAVCRGGPMKKRRVLMDGLIKMVGADCWWWSVASSNGPDGRPAYTALSHGGFQNGQFAKLLAAVDDPVSCTIFNRLTRELEERKTHMTRTRRQMDPDGHFRRERTHELWREAGVADLMLSVCPLDSGDYSAVGIYRSNIDADFEPRDALITHMLMSEVSWLHLLGWSDDDGSQALAKLSPRRRTVLNLMLEGQSRKEMAASMGISGHTLDGYVKDIFRLFKVHSQAELIARFRAGIITPGSGD